MGERVGKEVSGAAESADHFLALAVGRLGRKRRLLPRLDLLRVEEQQDSLAVYAMGYEPVTLPGGVELEAPLLLEAFCGLDPARLYAAETHEGAGFGEARDGADRGKARIRSEIPAGVVGDRARVDNEWRCSDGARGARCGVEERGEFLGADDRVVDVRGRRDRSSNVVGNGLGVGGDPTGRGDGNEAFQVAVVGALVGTVAAEENRGDRLGEQGHQAVVDVGPVRKVQRRTDIGIVGGCCGAFDDVRDLPARLVRSTGEPGPHPWAAVPEVAQPSEVGPGMAGGALNPGCCDVGGDLVRQAG